MARLVRLALAKATLSEISRLIMHSCHAVLNIPTHTSDYGLPIRRRRWTAKRLETIGAPEDGVRLIATHTRPVNLDVDLLAGALDQKLDELTQQRRLTAAHVHDPAGVHIDSKLAQQ